MKRLSNHDKYDENLAEQRGEALSLAIILGAGLVFVWFAWLIWPITGKSAPPNAWIACISLSASLALSYSWKDNWPRLASLVYLWGGWVSILFAVQSYPILAIGYLFFIPLILAGLLVEQRDYRTLVLACLGGVLWLGMVEKATKPVDLVIQIAGIGLLTFAVWLTDRNLKTLLTWIWNSYEKVLSSEQRARQGEADLEQALHARDEANTYLERANRQIAIVRDQAVEARQLKQQFVQTISHELRTPLNLIVGFTELMVKSPEYYKSPLPPAYLRDLNIVYRNATHLQSLVNDVLDLARIEAAQMSLMPELVKVRELVSSLEPIAASLSQVYHLPFHLECEGNLPDMWIDPTRTRQVMLNLVNNAYRFTEEGSVSLRAKRAEAGVIFSVIDTGMGIPPEQQKSIFEEFHQLDGSTRRQQGGTGLGLAISRRFVEMQGGRIWVESVSGEGSTFSFYLPAKGEALISGMAESTEEQVGVNSSSIGPGQVLLVVSPSLSATMMLQRYVRGVRIISARDMAEGRALAKKMHPRLVLFDKSVLDGYSGNLDELARAWGLESCTLIACPLPGGDDLASRLDIAAYLVKPVSSQNLNYVLENLGIKIKHVVVIDDNRDFVRFLSSILTPAPMRCRVTAAYSAEEGLAMLASLHVDVVLLDLNLPDGSGLIVLEQMRANQRLRKVPVIIVSALDQNTVLPTTQGEIEIYQSNGFAPAQIVQWVNQAID
jgi:signal transduction histidine kinase